MALVREYHYKGKEITVTVNKNGTRYIGVVNVAGMQIAPALRQVLSGSEEHAFTLGRKKAEELIDHPPAPLVGEPT